MTGERLRRLDPQDVERRLQRAGRGRVGARDGEADGKLRSSVTTERLVPSLPRSQAQVKQLYCGGNAKDYENHLIQPAGQIDRELIVSEKANIDRIVATLALKEMTQSILIRKLCALPIHNRTRKAIFEFDRLIRSIYGRTKDRRRNK